MTGVQTCALPISKVIAELDSKKGIGLIEKKRQGLGKPDIIYVKNFAAHFIEMAESQQLAENRSCSFRF